MAKAPWKFQSLPNLREPDPGEPFFEKLKSGLVKIHASVKDLREASKAPTYPTRDKDCETDDSGCIKLKKEASDLLEKARKELDSVVEVRKRNDEHSMHLFSLMDDIDEQVLLARLHTKSKFGKPVLDEYVKAYRHTFGQPFGHHPTAEDTTCSIDTSAAAASAPEALSEVRPAPLSPQKSSSSAEESAETVESSATSSTASSTDITKLCPMVRDMASTSKATYSIVNELARAAESSMTSSIEGSIATGGHYKMRPQLRETSVKPKTCHNIAKEPPVDDETSAASDIRSSTAATRHYKMHPLLRDTPITSKMKQIVAKESPGNDGASAASGIRSSIASTKHYKMHPRLRQTPITSKRIQSIARESPVDDGTSTDSGIGGSFVASRHYKMHPQLSDQPATSKRMQSDSQKLLGDPGTSTGRFAAAAKTPWYKVHDVVPMTPLTFDKPRSPPGESVILIERNATSSLANCIPITPPWLKMHSRERTPPVKNESIETLVKEVARLAGIPERNIPSFTTAAKAGSERRSIVRDIPITPEEFSKYVEEKIGGAGSRSQSSGESDELEVEKSKDETQISKPSEQQKKQVRWLDEQRTPEPPKLTSMQNITFSCDSDSSDAF